MGQILMIGMKTKFGICVKLSLACLIAEIMTNLEKYLFISFVNSRRKKCKTAYFIINCLLRKNCNSF